MAQAIDQAERERELTKQSLEGNLGRLEAKVRYELDWKARLRRDGARYALIGGAVVALVAGGLVLRRVVGGGDDAKSKRPARRGSSLDEIAEELADIRKRLDAAKVEPDGGPVWQKIALRGVSAAAAAGGTFAARRLLSRAGAVTEKGEPVGTA